MTCCSVACPEILAGKLVTCSTCCPTEWHILPQAAAHAAPEVCLRCLQLTADQWWDTETQRDMPIPSQILINFVHEDGAG